MADNQIRSNRPHFAMVTAEVAATLADKPFALVVFVHLALYADYRTKRCFPSLATLMRDTNLCKNTVLKSLKQLESVGLLVIERPSDSVSPNTYILRELGGSSDEPGVVHDVNRGGSSDELKRKPVNENHVNEISPKVPSAQLAVPDDIQPDPAWADVWLMYLDFRRTKKGWSTKPEWQRKNLKYLHQCNDPRAVIENSLRNEYQGLNESWVGSGKKPSSDMRSSIRKYLGESQ